MALRANLWKDSGKICIQTAYNIALVRLINTLPKQDEFYRDETRTWYIDLKHEPIVTSWLRQLGYMVTQLDSLIPTPLDEDFSILGLLPTAVWEVCEAAYKALCRVHHPDMGGNLDTMQQINGAWEKVKLAKGK